MVIGFYAGVAENTGGVEGTNIRFNPKKREKPESKLTLPFLSLFYLLPHLQHLRVHLKTSIAKVAVQTQFYWNGPSPAGKRGTESSEVIGFSTTQEHCGMVSWSRFFQHMWFHISLVQPRHITQNIIWALLKWLVFIDFLLANHTETSERRQIWFFWWWN